MNMKAKGILFLFIFSITFGLYGQSNISVWNGGASTWTQGAGTQSDPYLIESADHFAYLASATNVGSTFVGEYFKLMIDIDLDNLSWTPIGNAAASTFQGNFDGNGHTIFQLNILASWSATNYNGLFGNLLNASISKLNIRGGTINVGTSALSYVGALAGYANNSNIDSCGSDVYIIVNTSALNASFNTSVGGIVGHMIGNNGDLTNSYNKGKITYYFDVNYASTTANTFHNYVGGLVGYVQHSDVINCANLNDIVATNDILSHRKTSNLYLGGIVGYGMAAAATPLNINRSYNKGSLTINNKASCTNTSYDAIANGYAGGIIGYHHTGYINITNCYNRGDIAPYVYSYNSSYNNYAYTYIGGISGYINTVTSSSYANCYNTGAVPSSYFAFDGNAGTGTKTYGHGCIAYNRTATSPSISNCYFLNSCGCTLNNNPVANSVTNATLKGSGMPSTLGSTDWTFDVNPECNDGYPVLIGGMYPPFLIINPATDITALSANVSATVDTLQINLEDCSEVGFEYKLIGTSVYTSKQCAINDSFATALGGLQSCSTYTYRPYAIFNGQTIYGDTSDVTLLCHSVVQIDTTLCPLDTLYLFGRTFYPADSYYFLDNNITYRINFHTYPSRDNYISTSILEGENYYVNGVAYNNSGRYVIRFDTDNNGCDSVVYLTLQVIPTQVSVWQGTVQPWVFGDGSSRNPYLIENAAQLA